MRGRVQPSGVEEGCICMWRDDVWDPSDNSIQNYAAYRSNSTGPVLYPQRNSAEIVRQAE